LLFILECCVLLFFEKKNFFLESGGDRVLFVNFLSLFFDNLLVRQMTQTRKKIFFSSPVTPFHVTASLPFFWFWFRQKKKERKKERKKRERERERVERKGEKKWKREERRECVEWIGSETERDTYVFEFLILNLVKKHRERCLMFFISKTFLFLSPPSFAGIFFFVLFVRSIELFFFLRQKKLPDPPKKKKY
jgi:hypothetical protein